jgi:thiol-disulfide isomerase/thioredoxin
VRALVLSALVITACTAGGRAEPRLVASERSPSLPPLVFPTMDGGAFATDEARGQVVVLDVWATYCEPCRRAVPRLDRLAAARPDVLVVGLSIDEDDAVVRRFLDEVPATFAIARDREQTTLGPPLVIRKLPTVIIVDREGRVRSRIDEASEEDYHHLLALVDALRAE